MDRWQQYLFRAHSEATLRAWAARLRMFRFFRAYGGHGISLSKGYEVSEADVAVAEALEPQLAGMAAQRVEPPIDNEHCICPKYYPSYFV